jgi:transmembrane sensor
MRNGWFFWRMRASAAQWFVRLRAGPITPTVDAKFRRWLAADPAHEVDFERQELAWELAGELENDAEIQALVADAQSAGPSRRAQHAQRHLWTWSAVAAALGILAIGIAYFVQWPNGGDVYVAGIGEQRTILLPDESRMTLNTDTQVRVMFRRNVRAIEIERGEATFSVTHDAQRPFEVHAGRGLARALGTQFNVLSSAQGATVSVLSGRVEVVADGADQSSGPHSAILVQGQEASYDTTGVSPVHSAKAARIYAWHSGRIAFEDVDLEHALIEFNRYTATPVVLEDRSLGTVRVTGVFRIGQTDALLQALHTAFGIRSESTGSSIKLHRDDVK